LPRNSTDIDAGAVLSDGGLFDNLGTSCLEPGRSPEHSYDVYEVDIIVIATDAGRGAPRGLVPRQRTRSPGPLL
jgi:NTE family protein